VNNEKDLIEETLRTPFIVCVEPEKKIMLQIPLPS